MFCNKKFSQTHGNQRYCSIPCKKCRKASSQQKLYGIIKEFRKGFLGNYKLFEQLLPKSGKKSFPLTEMNNLGFKHTCYYKAFIDDEKITWYTVGNYSFSIKATNQTYYLTLLNK